MANDRWVAPIAELLASLSDNGGSLSGTARLTWSNVGNLAQRAGTRLTAWGTITTTGSPHLGLKVAALVDGPYSSSALERVCPTGVTGQPWAVEYIEYCTDASDTAPKTSYRLTTTGLFATDYTESGTYTGTSGGFHVISVFGFTWETVSADADAGDSITMQGCIVESIG